MDISKEELGNRIKEIRLSKGKTMKEFGELFVPEASDSIVSRWERGVSVPNSQRLKRIAELGDMTTTELLLGNKELQIIQEIKKHISDFPFSDSERDFLESIKEELIPLLLKRVDEYGEDVPLLYLIVYVQERLERLADVHSSWFGISVFDITFKELNFPKIKEDLEYFYTNISSLDPETLTKEISIKKQNEKNNIEEKLKSILASDEEHEINKQAFEDTVNCFSQIDMNISNMDFMTVYMQNLYYHEEENGHRINSKESYLNFLEERTGVLEKKLKDENLSLMDRSTFEMVLNIDKTTINEIK